MTTMRMSMAAVAIAVASHLGAMTTGAQQVTASPQARPARAAIYTEAQALHGEQVFTKVCSFCHGTETFAGATFQRSWKGMPVGKFYNFIVTTMPIDLPGRLTPQEYADVVAYILKLNDYPAGRDALVPDSKEFDSFLLEFN